MADSERSDQERNLPPTAKRLEDARKEGQVPRSRDLAHLMMLGGAVGLFVLLANPLMDAGKRVVAHGLSFNALMVSEPTQMTARLADLVGIALLALAPFFAALVAAALAAPLVIGGWMFSLNAVAPKFERMNPGSGLARMFSPRALVELTKVMVVAILLAGVGGWYLMGHTEEFASLASESLPSALPHFGGLFIAAFAMLTATLAASASIDVPFQLFSHISKLKMSLEEIRREEKETQGDPHIKQRIRSQQREMARKRMMSSVPSADVVVTNPTHYAVALKYSDGRHRAPVVVAKGADEVAARIRELARENGVPQLEAPPLARALYRHVEIDAEIPAALYGAVAQVLAYVFQLKAFATGQAARPVEPRDIEVPDGLDPAEAMATA